MHGTLVFKNVLLDTGYFLSWLFSRQTLLIAGTLLLIISPFLSVALYSGAAIATVVRWRQLIFTKERIAIGCFILTICIWMFFRKVIPEDYQPGRVAFTDYVPLFIFFYLISLAPFSESESKRFSYALALTIPQQFLLAFGEKYLNWHGGIHYFIGKRAIIDIFIGPFDRGANVSASLYNPNILVLYCVICASILVSLFLREIERLRVDSKFNLALTSRILLVSICLILCVIMIGWAGSRNGLLALIFIIIVFSWSSRSLRYLKIVGAGLLFITIVASLKIAWISDAARSLFPKALSIRMDQGFIINVDEERRAIYNCAVQLIRERPLEGWGLGMFTSECSKRVGHWVCSAHDIFLQLAAEIGIPFTVLIVCLFGYIFFLTTYNLLKKGHGWNIDNILDKGFLIAVITVFLMQVFDLALLMTYRLHFVFWICFAIPYSRIYLETRNKANHV